MSTTSMIETSGPGEAASQSGPAPATARWSRNVAADVVAATDMLAVALGGLLPAIIYATMGNLRLDWLMVVQSCIIAAFITQLCLRTWGFYETDKLKQLPQNPLLLLGALAVGIIMVVGFALPAAVRNAHLWVWYSAWLSASFTLLLAGRMTARALLARYSAEGRFDQRIAVFGAGGIARRVHEHLVDGRLGIHFAGVYDDRAKGGRVDTEGLEVNGGLEELVQAAREGRIDQIVVAMPQAADRRIADIVKKLDQLPVDVRIVTHIASDLYQRPDNAHAVASLGPVGLMEVKRRPFADWQPIWKAFIDYGCGSLLAIAAVPVAIAAAVAIKLDSDGPILFRQKRRGLNGATFDVLKFRTMTVMEDGNAVKQVSAGDPRITRVGRFLRRSSIDELPQLWNVLRGEMSLVGPRPHALVHDDEYSQKLEEYAARHQVKPGITGLAQVKGWRGETSTDDKMRGRIELDITYIKTWTPWLDLKILAQTVVAVIRGKNAA